MLNVPKVSKKVRNLVEVLESLNSKVSAKLSDKKKMLIVIN